MSNNLPPGIDPEVFYGPPEPQDPEPCDHAWEFRDDSFDHEFGTERIHFWECPKCGATKPTCSADYGRPEPDDEVP